MAGGVPEDAIRVQPERLREMTAEIFRAVGLPEADAERVADCLVQVDLRGVFSHGTRQLVRYVREYRFGGLNPKPEIRLVRETPVTALFDGDGGLGYLAATRATEAVIEKADVQGVAIAGSCNHGHVGSEGIYARMALARDLATFSVAGGREWEKPAKPDATVWDAMMSPPMCFGIPSAEGPPLVLDMSANMFRDSSRIEEAMERFPEALIKSLGLKFVSTLLGGILAGALPEGEGKFSAASRGFTIVAFRLDTVGDVEGFKQEAARILRESMSLNPLPGQERAELPGSLEWKREQDWVNEGIPLGSAHREALAGVAGELGVEVAW
ncbi:MAG: Ldh family oxidoreductase [bacterium]|nr:Ldh family oxidoreductase [bacterium]